MALSGSFTGSTNNQYIEPKIVWRASQNIAGNYSDVTATLYYSRTNTGYTTKGTWSGSININGTSKSNSPYLTITHNSNTVAVSNTVRVYHTDNGTKSITISASGSIPGTSFSSTSISKTITLDTIPRVSTPTLSATSVQFGSSITVSTNRASSTFTHKLTYSFNGGSETNITTGITTSYTWTVPKSLMNSIPKAKKATITLRLYTYSGSTSIGSKSISFTATVPETSETKPTVTLSVSEAVSAVKSKLGVYVKGLSKLSITASGSYKYGASVSSYRISANDVTYTSANVTTGLLGKSGTMTITATITDSRGLSGTASVSINVKDYAKPYINSFRVVRCEADGTASDVGDNFKATYNLGVTNISGNTPTYTLSYKKKNDSNYTYITLATSGSTLNSNRVVQNIDIDQTYDVKISVKDQFYETVSTVALSTAFTLIDYHKDGHGMAVGKVSEKAAFECALNAEFKGNVNIDGNINRDISSFVWSANNISTSGRTQIIKKFPSLDVCFFKCYCKTEKQFAAGSSYLIGTVDLGFYPSYLTPLCVFVAGHKNAETWIEDDGKIYVYARETISSGVSIYINGTWLPK